MEKPTNQRQVLTAVLGSTIGTTIEWYDFFLYGTAAAIVFPKVFFPDNTEFIAQLLSFSTFTVGFLSRPLGGAIFGRIGDRQGRKVALVATLLLMGISTLLIGFLPTYEQIGVAAPVALVALRFLQGIGVGGEWGGAVLLALESGQRGRRGLLASWPQIGVPLGLLLSTGMMTLCVRLIPNAEFLAWGWRIPFFASFLLIVVGFLIRSFVTESPLFAQLKAHHQTAQAPVLEVLTKNWKQILLGAGARLSDNAVFYILTAYVLSYGDHVLKVPRASLLTSVNVAAAVACFTMPLFGFLSDFWPRRSLYQCGNALMILLAVPYYALLDTRQPAAILIATVVMLAIPHAMLYGVQAALIAELFPTRLRYSGASLAYQLAGPFAGGLAPIIATSLAYRFPGNYWPLAGYIVFVAVVSSVCVHFLGEANQDPRG
jgi:metabolite-proton symporter